MGGAIELSGTAQLTSGVIDLHQIGALTVMLVKAGHAFRLVPNAEDDEGWTVALTVELQNAESLRLLQELRGTGLFGA